MRQTTGPSHILSYRSRNQYGIVPLEQPCKFYVQIVPTCTHRSAGVFSGKKKEPRKVPPQVFFLVPILTPFQREKKRQETHFRLRNISWATANAASTDSYTKRSTESTIVLLYISVRYKNRLRNFFIRSQTFTPVENYELTQRPLPTAPRHTPGSSGLSTMPPNGAWLLRFTLYRNLDLPQRAVLPLVFQVIHRGGMVVHAL